MSGVERNNKIPYIGMSKQVFRDKQTLYYSGGICKINLEFCRNNWPPTNMRISSIFILQKGDLVYMKTICDSYDPDIHYFNFHFICNEMIY